MPGPAGSRWGRRGRKRPAPGVDSAAAREPGGPGRRAGPSRGVGVRARGRRRRRPPRRRGREAGDGGRRRAPRRRRWRRRRRREPRQDAPRVGREALEVGEAEEAVRGVGADGELARVEHAARPRRERDAQRAPRRVERELQRLAARRSILEATAVVAPPVRGQPVRRGELARARREAGHRGRGAGADGPERVAGDREERKCSATAVASAGERGTPAPAAAARARRASVRAAAAAADVGASPPAAASARRAAATSSATVSRCRARRRFTKPSARRSACTRSAARSPSAAATSASVLRLILLWI